jgi:hypothetical protein
VAVSPIFFVFSPASHHIPYPSILDLYLENFISARALGWLQNKENKDRITGVSDFIHRPDFNNYKNFFFFLVIIKIRTMDKVRNPSNSVCYTPSSEPYRIYKENKFYGLFDNWLKSQIKYCRMI